MRVKEIMRSEFPGMWKNVRLIRNAINRIRKPVVFGELSNHALSERMGLDRGQAIDRWYIERFLETHKKYVKGDLLEIADSQYSKKYAHGESRYHILTFDKEAYNKDGKVIYGDLTDKSTLIPEVADCFICTQTLNFIFDVKKAVHGVRYLLKNGGVALVTVAGISQISPFDYERWGDFWRFTDQSIRRLFEDEFGNDNIKVQIYGNLVSCMAYLQGLCVEDLPDIRMLEKKNNYYQCIIGIMARKIE